MVLTASRGRGALTAAVLGSACRRLIEAAATPVMVVPPEAEPAFTGRSVVAGIDRHSAEPEGVAGVAAALAQLLRAQLVLSHLIPDENHSGAVARSFSNRLNRDTRAALLQLRARLRALPDGSRAAAESRLRRGDPAVELDRLATEVSADVIVVVSGRTGRVRAARGACVALKLARRAPHAVLVVPDPARPT